MLKEHLTKSAPITPEKGEAKVVAAVASGSPSSAAAQLGRLGGVARARKLTPENRKEIARKAAMARWSPLDWAMVLDAAKKLEAEALTWKQGFAIYQGKRRGYVWPQNSDTPWAQARAEGLEQSARYLRALVNEKAQPRPDGRT